MTAQNSLANRLANFGAFSLSPSRRRLVRDNSTVQLGGRAMDLLIALVESAGEILSHRQLLARGWPGLTVEDANIRVHISALRKVLDVSHADESFIETVIGRGYSFVGPVIWSEECIQAGPTDIANPAERDTDTLTADCGPEGTARADLGRTLLIADRLAKITPVEVPPEHRLHQIGLAAVHLAQQSRHAAILNFADQSAVLILDASDLLMCGSWPVDEFMSGAWSEFRLLAKGDKCEQTPPLRSKAWLSGTGPFRRRRTHVASRPAVHGSRN